MQRLSAILVNAQRRSAYLAKAFSVIYTAKIRLFSDMRSGAPLSEIHSEDPYLLIWVAELRLLSQCTAETRLFCEMHSGDPLDHGHEPPPLPQSHVPGLPPLPLGGVIAKIKW